MADDIVRVAHATLGLHPSNRTRAILTLTTEDDIKVEFDLTRRATGELGQFLRPVLTVMQTDLLDQIIREQSKEQEGQ